MLSLSLDSKDVCIALLGAIVGWSGIMGESWIFTSPGRATGIIEQRKRIYKMAIAITQSMS